MLIYTASRVKQSLEAACCSNAEDMSNILSPSFKSEYYRSFELCPFEFMPSPVTSKLVSVFLDGFNIIRGLIVEIEECNKIPGAQRESAELGKNSL